MLFKKAFKQSYKKLGYGFQINLLSALIVFILKWIELGEEKPNLIAILIVLTPIMIVLLVLSVETITVIIKVKTEIISFHDANAPNDNELMEKIMHCSQIISNPKRRTKVKESELHLVCNDFIFVFYPRLIAPNEYPMLCREELIMIIKYLNLNEDKLENKQRGYYQNLKQTTEFHNYIKTAQQNT